MYVYTYYLESKSSSERELCEPLTRSCARRDRLIIASMPISSFYLVFFFLFFFSNYIIHFVFCSRFVIFFILFYLFLFSLCLLSNKKLKRLDSISTSMRFPADARYYDTTSSTRRYFVRVILHFFFYFCTVCVYFNNVIIGLL